MTKTPDMTREAWLEAMTEAMRPWLADVGAPLPERVRVSVGWPSSRGISKTGGSHTIGQCWSANCSKAGTPEVFISPLLDEATRVADVLLHELVHAAVGNEAGHGAAFARPAKALGLTGKMTATVASDELRERLVALVAEVGPYPHAGIEALAIENRKKQGTRMLKVECPDCGYSLRTTRKWLEVGVPTCCCGSEMEVV
jgi:hypothetical protein